MMFEVLYLVLVKDGLHTFRISLKYLLQTIKQESSGELDIKFNVLCSACKYKLLSGEIETPG